MPPDFCTFLSPGHKGRIYMFLKSLFAPMEVCGSLKICSKILWSSSLQAVELNQFPSQLWAALNGIVWKECGRSSDVWLGHTWHPSFLLALLDHLFQEKPAASLGHLQNPTEVQPIAMWVSHHGSKSSSPNWVPRWLTSQPRSWLQCLERP